MAVPPGNKQIGQVMVASTYSVAANSCAVTLHNFSMVAVVDDPTRLYTVQPAKNLQIGTVDLQLVSGVAANVAALNLHQFNMIAVVRYDPPTSIDLSQFTITPVVTDLAQSARPVAALKNLGVGNVAIVTTTKMPPDLVQMAIEQFVVIAVVREFHPRKEHTTINIEYGADAEFNTGGN